MQDLQTFFAEQREKFEKQRADAQAKLDEAESELRALDAYEQAKAGKPARTQSSTNGKPRKPRESGKRKEVLDLVASFPNGATAGELKDKLGIRGQKAPEQSLSNALASLKKSGQLTLTDGLYQVPA